MYKFSQLCIGDMFNTMVGRFVKTSDTEAICVMSTIVPLGTIHEVADSVGIVLLWSCVLESN